MSREEKEAWAGRPARMERMPVGAAVALPGGPPGAPCGPWEMRERLGIGGFGNVSLYQHRVSPPLRGVPTSSRGRESPGVITDLHLTRVRLPWK